MTVELQDDHLHLTAANINACLQYARAVIDGEEIQFAGRSLAA
jgi:uncharacterized protein (DUF433 family)